MNVHLQYYAKNVGNIQNNFKRVVEKIDRCEDDIGLLQQGQTDQETFNQAILERMREMETKIEEQTERIVSLEEEVSELEYAEEEGSSSGASYHIPLVTPEETLLVFRSPPISQTLPSKVQETCGCPVPAVITIEDNVEISVVPRENEEAIPVQVERPPAYTVGLQRSSRGRPMAHYRSFTHCANRHSKQLGSHLYHHPSPGVKFPCE